MACCHFFVPLGWHAAYRGKNSYNIRGKHNSVFPVFLWKIILTNPLALSCKKAIMNLYNFD